MKDVLRQITRWSRGGDRVAVAMVVGARRSAPRPLGTKMVVNRRGEIAGGVSGGCVEGAVVEIAERVIDGAPSQLARFGIPDDDAWEVGLPCGGEIDVWVQAFEWSRFAEVARTDGRVAEVTLLDGDGAGAKLVVELDGTRTGSLGSPELDAEGAEVAGQLLWEGRSERHGRLFVDVTAPAPRLVLVGALDIAAALCVVARASGWLPYVIDPRARFATAERFQDAEDLVVAWPRDAFARLGGIDPATSVVALAHDPKIDDAALTLALRSPAAFVGAMGSRSANAQRFERLLMAGLDEQELGRLSAPVGLDLGASSPEETALSIMAEVVAASHAHLGGRLSERPGRIHTPAPAAA
ncbi:MAG: XdhC family protein [Conexibacter sp.]|nr:XdhC family protein [Conexibacter sp.]